MLVSLEKKCVYGIFWKTNKYSKHACTKKVVLQLLSKITKKSHTMQLNE